MNLSTKLDIYFVVMIVFFTVLMVLSIKTTELSIINSLKKLNTQTEIVEIYTANDIYYCDFVNMQIKTEKGSEFKFKSNQQLVQFISDITASDLILK